LNKILNAGPAAGEDQFTYRTPQWVEAIYCGLVLSIAGVLTYAALSINGIPFLLEVFLWLASGILILIALRPRAEAASIHFVCDHGGIYFPSSRAQSIVAQPKNVPWLHVPWHNVSDIRIQLLLDETANTKGVVFSVVASASEEREFLARHRVRMDRGVPNSGFGKKCLVGFSNFFHRHHDVISHFERFQTTAPAVRVQRNGAMLESRLAGES